MNRATSFKSTCYDTLDSRNFQRTTHRHRYCGSRWQNGAALKTALRSMCCVNHTGCGSSWSYLRRKREQILRGILGSLYAKKDSQRGFKPEQRRIVWNTASSRTCTTCARKTWEDFTINPYCKGGLSQLENAAMMCRKHNSLKVSAESRAGACYTLSLIPSLGACTKSCFVPRYRSVV
jgi:hypothetical protein